MTSSPTPKPVTPGPVSATIPARSLPCPDGNVAGHRECSRPSRILASPGLIPAALTWTSTWPGPGTGVGTSTTLRTSMSPYSSNRTAFTSLPPFSKTPQRRGRAAYARGSPAQPLDDLGGGQFGRQAVALSGPQRHAPGVPAGRGGGAQRPGGVVDLGIGRRRVRVFGDEPIDQPASGASAEGPGHDGGGVTRVGQRGLVQRMRAAFRAAQEGGPALRRHRARGQHGPHLAR